MDTEAVFQMTLEALHLQDILGGFGLFMFGITYMGDGLKQAAGDKLRDYIDKYTKNPFSAFLIGIVITVVMQSSSASTAVTIGLVRASLMTLEQAAGIIVGANVGSTITSFLISLNIGKYTMFVIFLGAMFIAFSKARKLRYAGDVLFGFGLMFFGLNFMGDALSGLKDLPEFAGFAMTMSNSPFLSMVAGAIMTALVQASSATIGVVQKMYQGGALSFTAVLPFVFGANIGTTITGIFASVGGSTASKRTAAIHTMFNVVGTTVGMLLLKPYSAFIKALTANMNLNPMMEIAFAHIIFNSLAALCFFPFLKQICALIKRVISGTETKRRTLDIPELDPTLARSLPSAAITAGIRAVEQMGLAVKDDVVECNQFLYKMDDMEIFESLKQNETDINRLDTKITTYFIQVSRSQNLSIQDENDIRMNLEVIKNLERIGDLNMNVSEFFVMVSERNETFSEEAQRDINKMFTVFNEMFNLTMDIYATKSLEKADQLTALEQELDHLEYTLRQDHFLRMSMSGCTSAIGASVYCDILANLERMGDHTCNILRAVRESLEVESSKIS